MNAYHYNALYVNVISLHLQYWRLLILLFFSLWTIQPPSSVSLSVQGSTTSATLALVFPLFFFRHTSALRNASTARMLNKDKYNS